jgi:hypothetical protein
MSTSGSETSTNLFSPSDFLHNFMVFLAGFRNHESQYLQPLAQKASIALTASVSPRPFPQVDKEIEDLGSSHVEAQDSTFIQQSDGLAVAGAYSTIHALDIDNTSDSSDRA